MNWQLPQYHRRCEAIKSQVCEIAVTQAGALIVCFNLNFIFIINFSIRWLSTLKSSNKKFEVSEMVSILASYLIIQSNML